MRKLILTLCIAITAIAGASAQYFQHLYAGAASPSGQLYWGTNTHLPNLPGHFMTGVGYGVLPNTYEEIIATYTDQTGKFPGAPYFNRIYQIVGSYPSQSYSIKGFEYAGGFGVVGMYAVLPFLSYEIFYLRLDASGNVLGSYGYSIPGTPMPQYVISNVTVSGTGNEIYVTGLAETSTVYNILGMKIDIATGAVVWSKLYPFGTTSITLSAKSAYGMDIIESPYNNNEAIIVGGATDTAAGSVAKGFMLRVNSNTGVPLLSPRIFGTPGVTGAFSSITVANSPFGGTGFVVAGGCDRGSNRDMWILKTDQICNAVVWSKLFNNNSQPTATDECFDVIERNNGGMYEYYAGGFTAVSNTDAMVIKTDQTGAGMPLGQFVYGNGSDHEACRALDQYNGTPGYDGLSVFCNYSTGSGVNYMDNIKAYFNGVTPCKQSITATRSFAGPTFFTVAGIANVAGPTLKALTINYMENGIDVKLCDTNSLPNGSNLKTLTIEQNEQELSTATTLSPNPANATQPITIRMYSEKNETIQIIITDILGRQVYSSSNAVEEGVNKIQINIQDVHLSPGVYNVGIHKSGSNETIRLAVE